MQVKPAMHAFASREPVECPACGDPDNLREQSYGQLVCEGCGAILSHGPRLAREPTFVDRGQYSGMALDPQQGGSAATIHSKLLQRVRNIHPACEETVAEYMRVIGTEFEKGMKPDERVRNAQALTYIAYRDDGKDVTLASLAEQIRVPEEGLSKDVKLIASKLGLRGFSMVDSDTDAFASAMLTLLAPDRMARGRHARVREVNKWCRSLFAYAHDAGEVDVINMAPRHQAAGAAAVYCESVGDPFKPGTFDSSSKNAYMALTRNPTARRASTILRAYVKHDDL